MRILQKTFAILLITGATGCSCLPKSRPLSSYQFAIYHPTAVEVYKPIGGSPPNPDFIYVYLRIENTGSRLNPISFGWWNDDEQRWQSAFHYLKPVVKVVNQNAPILTQPEVLVTGLSTENICPGRIFPPVAPEEADFPQNEASFRRDFAIRFQPDRTMLDHRGFLDVTFSLDYADESAAEASSPAVHFRIPISIVDRFRPDALVVEPSTLP